MKIPGQEIDGGIYVGIIVGDDGPYHLIAEREDAGEFTWHEAMEKYGASVPSTEELNLMRANHRVLGMTGVHWSSTEYNGSNAWNQRFSDGSQYANTKNLTSKVRCVRRLQIRSFDDSKAKKPSLVLQELRKQTEILERIAGKP